MDNNTENITNITNFFVSLWSASCLCCTSCLCSCMQLNHTKAHLFRLCQGQGSVLCLSLVGSTHTRQTKWTLGFKCAWVKYEWPSVRVPLNCTQHKQYIMFLERYLWVFRGKHGWKESHNNSDCSWVKNNMITVEPTVGQAKNTKRMVKTFI